MVHQLGLLLRKSSSIAESWLAQPHSFQSGGESRVAAIEAYTFDWGNFVLRDPTLTCSYPTTGLSFFTFVSFNFFKGRKKHHIPNSELKTKITFYCLELLNKIRGFRSYLSLTTRSPKVFHTFVLQNSLHFNFSLNYILVLVLFFLCNLTYFQSWHECCFCYRIKHTEVSSQNPRLQHSTIIGLW